LIHGSGGTKDLEEDFDRAGRAVGKEKELKKGPCMWWQLGLGLSKISASVEFPVRLGNWIWWGTWQDMTWSDPGGAGALCGQGKGGSSAKEEQGAKRSEQWNDRGEEEETEETEDVWRVWWWVVGLRWDRSMALPFVLPRQKAKSDECFGPLDPVMHI
jgi:hypothetical protein